MSPEPEIRYRDRLGRQQVIVEVTGQPEGSQKVRQHEHVFSFAGKQETVRHAHLVRVTDPEHIHPVNRVTSYSRFPKEPDDAA